MESKLFIALLVAALLAFSVASDDDSNGSDSGSGTMGSWGDSFEGKDEDCDRLVDGSDDNDGDCDLVDGLKEVKDKCTKCSSDDKLKIEQWIAELKIEISVKVTIEERLILASACIQKFEMENPSIYELIQYQNVSSWGMLSYFNKVVEIRQTTKVESLITLDDEDNCPLFDALLNCTEGSYEQQSAVNALINETLLEICGDMSLSVTKRNVKIFEAIQKFFSINAEWQSTFFQFKIQGFGTFQQFYQITKSSYQKTQVDVVLQGEVSECSFIVSFKAQLEFIKSDSSISTSVKATLTQFYDRIFQQLTLSTKVTGKARLSIIIKEMNDCIKMYPGFAQWIYSIQIDGFGSFLDLIFCGPGKIGFPPKPTMPMVSASPKPTCSCTCASTIMPTSVTV